MVSRHSFAWKKESILLCRQFDIEDCADRLIHPKNTFTVESAARNAQLFLQQEM